MGKIFTKAEFLALIANLPDDAQLEFYVSDYEYDDHNPYDCGTGTLVSIEHSFTGINYINIGINKIS